MSQNLGDSAFSGALWPGNFDSLSRNLNKGGRGHEEGEELLRPPFVGQPPQSCPPGRRPLSQKDDCISPGGLACDPSLLRTTLSRAVVSGLGLRGEGVDRHWLPASTSQLLTCPSCLQLPTGRWRPGVARQEALGRAPSPSPGEPTWKGRGSGSPAAQGA